MRDQSGFTLMEVLVAGTISVLIPATLIMVITTSNREISGGAGNMRLSQISTVISETIHRAGLTASSVYSESEKDQTGTQCPGAAPGVTSDLTGIIFCDETGAIKNGFRIGETQENRGVLEEYTVGGVPKWKPMVFSNDTVKVTLDPTAGMLTQKWGDLFGIDGKAAFAWMNLRLDMEVGGVRMILPLQTQSIVCRNAPARLVTTGW